MTNHRVINIAQTGLFNRRVQEVELENIFNIEYEVKGVMKNLMNFGNIKLTTVADQTNSIIFPNVENPHFIFEKISDARKRVMNKKHSD